MKMDFNINSAPGEILPLNELEPGSEAVVVEVEDTGPISRRLLDLGLLPETPVKVLRRAPLGDPSIYELRGYRLCLRKGDAARVRVRSAK
jgi:Fe2+ transport system protein FeoA